MSDDNIIPESFISVSEKVNVKIQDNKILFPKASFLSGILYLVITFSPYFIVFFYFDKIVDTFGLHNKSERDLCIIGIVFIGFLVYLFINSGIKSYKVIDFKYRILYDLDDYWGYTHTSNIIDIDDIVQVANNVIAQVTSPGGRFGTYNGRNVEVHPDTNLFHRYYLSFLLNSGGIIDFYEFGIFPEDYKNSVKFAKQFSKFFNKELVICKSTESLDSISCKLIKKDIEIIDESERNWNAIGLGCLFPVLLALIVVSIASLTYR